MTTSRREIGQPEAIAAVIASVLNGVDSVTGRTHIPEQIVRRLSDVDGLLNAAWPAATAEQSGESQGRYFNWIAG